MKNKIKYLKYGGRLYMRLPESMTLSEEPGGIPYVDKVWSRAWNLFGGPLVLNPDGTPKRFSGDVVIHESDPFGAGLGPNESITVDIPMIMALTLAMTAMRGDSPCSSTEAITGAFDIVDAITQIYASNHMATPFASLIEEACEIGTRHYSEEISPSGRALIEIIDSVSASSELGKLQNPYASIAFSAGMVIGKLLERDENGIDENIDDAISWLLDFYHSTATKKIGESQFTQIYKMVYRKLRKVGKAEKKRAKEMDEEGTERNGSKENED